MKKRSKAKRNNSSKSERDEDNRLRVASVGSTFSEAVIGATIDGTIVSWNTAAESLMGYSGEDVIGRNLKFLQSRSSPNLRIFTKRISNGETIYDLEAEWLKKDAKPIFVSITAQPVLDDSGEVIGATSTIRDITEQKHLIETLKQSDANYQLLTECSRMGIMVIQDGRIKFVNPWGEEAVGHTSSDLIGSAFAEIVLPEDREGIVTHLARVQNREQEPSSQIIRILDCSGDLYSMSVNSTPFNWEGKPATINFLVDVTTRFTFHDDQRKQVMESDESVVVIDRNNIIRFVSPGAFTLFGHEKDNYIGLPFKYPIVMDRSTEIEIETDLGERKFAEMHTVWAEWDEKPAYLISLKDITEKKKIEEDLRNSEEIFRRFISTMHEGAWFIDNKGITRFVNSRMADLLGYTTDEMQGKPFFSLVERRLQKIEKLWLQRRRQGIREKNEFELIRKDGRPIWTIVSTAPIANKYGKFMGSIAVVVDITDKKQAVEALQKSEEKYRALVENTSDLVARFDLDHRIVYANPAFSQVTNIPQGTLLGRTLGELEFPANMTGDCENAMDEVITIREPRERQVELLVMKGPIILDWRFSPELDASGNVLTILSVARDITRIKRAEEKIRHLASFAQLNPNPVIELDLRGNIIFANIATQFVLRRIGSKENETWRFLPPDISGILKEMKEGNTGLFCREIIIGRAVFGEQISLTPNTGRVWIYVSEVKDQRNLSR